MESIKKIIDERISISRFGDGEFFHLFNDNYNNSSGRQKCSKEIKKKLEIIINSNSENLMVCISGFLAEDKQIDEYYKDYSNYMKNFIKKTLKKINSKYPLLKDKIFYSAEITRITNSNYDNEIVELFDKYFSCNDFVFIGNKMVIKLIKQKFIDKFKSIKFIEVKKKDAYKDYDEIKDSILKYDNNNIFLLAIGITATILAFDLSKIGYIGVDIGHYFELLDKRNKRLKINK